MTEVAQQAPATSFFSSPVFLLHVAPHYAQRSFSAASSRLTGTHFPSGIHPSAAPPAATTASILTLDQGSRYTARCYEGDLEFDLSHTTLHDWPHWPSHIWMPLDHLWVTGLGFIFFKTGRASTTARRTLPPPGDERVFFIFLSFLFLPFFPFVHACLPVRLSEAERQKQRMRFPQSSLCSQAFHSWVNCCLTNPEVRKATQRTPRSICLSVLGANASVFLYMDNILLPC